MTCSLCQTAYYGGHPWDGDHPVCGFDENGSFSKDNWNCATLNKLRQLIEGGIGENYSMSFRDRWMDSSLGVLRAPDGWQLIMTWYKERGCIGDAFLVRDGERLELTEEVAQGILEMYKEH